MSEDRNGSSSDLGRARAISKRLRGEPPRAESSPKPDAGYVRFSARASKTESTRVASPPSDSFADVGSLVWDRLLDWCIAAFGAKSAFVVDAQGLVIANHGALSSEVVQGIGARSILALEHADRMTHETNGPRSVSFEFDGSWLEALRIPMARGTQLTIGMVTSFPLDREGRATLERAFRCAIEGM